jgi:hypothetical protein
VTQGGRSPVHKRQDLGWPKHEHLQGGRKNVRNEPLVDLKKIFLPPLGFKLGMKKNSVKTMVHDGKELQYIPQKYQSINQSVNPK